MKTVIITRQPSTDEGTFGRLSVDDGWNCKTGELPWRDNQNGVSCIPDGTYICKWILSPKHGYCYQVTGVPGRDMIEIHSANYCGDDDLGLKCELRGCIALGSDIGTLQGQIAVLNSRSTTAEFNSHMGGLDFELVIREG